MIRKLKKNTIVSCITYLLLINFINLSANFYHTSNPSSIWLDAQDPIDSLAEIIVEFIFEMDDQIIPDTEIPNEKRKIADLKLAFTKSELKIRGIFPLILNKWVISDDLTLLKGVEKISSPPPETLINFSA